MSVRGVSAEFTTLQSRFQGVFDPCPPPPCSPISRSHEGFLEEIRMRGQGVSAEFHHSAIQVSNFQGVLDPSPARLVTCFRESGILLHQGAREFGRVRFGLLRAGRIMLLRAVPHVWFSLGCGSQMSIEHNHLPRNHHGNDLDFRSHDVKITLSHQNLIPQEAQVTSIMIEKAPIKSHVRITL